MLPWHSCLEAHSQENGDEHHSMYERWGYNVVEGSDDYILEEYSKHQACHHIHHCLPCQVYYPSSPSSAVAGMHVDAAVAAAAED